MTPARIPGQAAVSDTGVIQGINVAKVSVIGPDRLVAELRRAISKRGSVHLESGVDVAPFLAYAGEEGNATMILGDDVGHVREELQAGSPSALVAISPVAIESTGSAVNVGLHGFATKPAREGSFPLSLVDDWGIDDVMAAAFDTLTEQPSAVTVLVDLAVLDSAFEPDSERAQPGGLDPRRLGRATFLAGRHSRVDRIGLVAAAPGSHTANLAFLALSFFAGFASRKDPAK